MPDSEISVAALTAAPVKGLRIMTRDALELEPTRIVGDRTFYLVDGAGRMVNGKHAKALQAITADYEELLGKLTLDFADGRRLSATVELGEELETRFYSTRRPARVVDGPFAEALSRELGREVRLVAPADGISGADRGRDGMVSLVCSASVERLAAEAGAEAVDARRFRMSIELVGPSAHAEDAWVGRCLQIGDALVRVSGHVGRCIVTTRDPDTGETDLPTLDLLRRYRASASTSEPLALGVYGAVLRGGTVSVGDPVLLDPPQ